MKGHSDSGITSFAFFISLPMRGEGNERNLWRYYHVS